MRILHTSDWHIGQKLYGRERYEEFQYFLDSLLEIIDKHKVDLLLVSGDIFDVPHPSNRSSEIYYSFLSRLTKTCCQKTIITGGNHDSISTINAPQPILKALNAEVFGGVTENIHDLIVNFEKNGEAVQIAAIPYLRDKDIKKSIAGQDAFQKEKSTKKGIIDFYNDVAKNLSSAKPAIAMGHLFALGVSTSESERDIHVGNLGAISANDFPKEFDYVALGHIHRPQIVGKNKMICYSGSPIQLSFSERKDIKSVVLLNLENGKIQAPERIEIFQRRKLIKIMGNLEMVIHQLENHQSNALPDWCEVEVQEEHYSPAYISKLEDFLNTTKLDLVVLKYRFQYKSLDAHTAYFIQENKHLEDLSPLEVFEKRIENLPTEDQKKQLNTFQQLLDINETFRDEN